MKFDITLTEGYSSASQKIRVMSEAWIKENVTCTCGGALVDTPNNTKGCDFVCSTCGQQYEAKTAKGMKPKKSITGGEYHTTVDRVSESNTHWILVTYNGITLAVTSVTVIDTKAITPSMVKPRKPLGTHCRRAGWQGCTLRFDSIPDHLKAELIF